MNKLLTLTFAGLFASQSVMAYASPKSLDGYMSESLSRLQKSGYEISLTNGKRAGLEDIYNLNGQVAVLTGGDLKGIEIHLKTSSKDEGVPSLILAAYRPNKERIAMTQIKFDLAGSFAENKIKFSRDVNVFLNLIQSKLYASSEQKASDRYPAMAGNLKNALCAFMGLVVVSMLLYIHIQVKHSGGDVQQVTKADKINEVIKQTAAKHNIEARAVKAQAEKIIIPKGNINSFLKRMGSGKTAKAMAIILVLGLGVNEMIQE